MGWIKRKEAELFADQVEEALDTILSGRELKEPEEVIEDTLWGKCGEKFWRLSQVWNTKEAQTEKLDFLLQSMVKMSRLENGIIQIKKEQSKLQETLTAAVSQVVPAASRKEISLHVDCEPELLLKYDRKWTEEAIFNVLDNAVKYTNPKGRIAVQVIHQEIFTKISVRDNGKGILPERQAEIFTRFYREPEVHDNHGVGIGLYLTRKILELQNGYIEVHSETGKGSDFCLYLPNEG